MSLLATQEGTLVTRHLTEAQKNRIAKAPPRVQGVFAQELRVLSQSEHYNPETFLFILGLPATQALGSL